MTLPHATEVSGEIAVKHRVQLEAMTKLHDTVIAMMSADSWTVRNTRGLNPIVAQTMIGLLAKASNVSIHSSPLRTWLARRRQCTRARLDGNNRGNRLHPAEEIEGTNADLPRSRDCAEHQDAQRVEEHTWSKRKATTAILKQANDALNSYLKRLPPGTDVKRQWSGKSSLQEAVRALRGDVMYATLYRFTSSISHAADFGAHFEVDPSSDDLIWRSSHKWAASKHHPTPRASCSGTRLIALTKRLRLGYAGALTPHKLTRSDVRKGQK